MKNVAEIAVADRLVAVRLEPILRDGKGSALVDLHFRSGERRAVIPFVLVDIAMLEARERDPLVWPAFVREANLQTDAINDRIEAWLFGLVSGKPLTSETWNIFGNEADGRSFLAGREAGFLGAAPIAEVARRAAPYVFARRHARGRDVLIGARDAALGASILAPLARRVQIAGSESRELAWELEWYAPALAEDDFSCEVAILDERHRGDPRAAAAVSTIDLDGGPGTRIEPAPAVPVDVLFDFSGAVVRDEPPFWVRASGEAGGREPIVPEIEAVGGSGGRILFGLRRGALRFGGADVELAETLATAMGEEGFTVTVVDDPGEVETFAPDLIHAFGLTDAATAAAYQREATTRSIPFALHTLYDGAGFGGCWGATVAPYCYRFAQDDVTVESLLTMMRERRLAVNQITAETPFHPNPHWEADVRRTIGAADVVYVAGEAERASLARFEARGEIVAVAPPIFGKRRPEPVRALVGSERFALVHAPIEPTQNQLQAVRAAQRADISLVVAGPVVDGEYAASVRSFAGDRTVLIGEPEPGAIEGLYAAADVFVDVAWIGCGLARAVRAVSRGAALAISNRLPVADLGLGEFARAVDPGDVEGIARGIADAWYLREGETGEFEIARRALAARSGVRAVTRAVAAGYLRALERRSPTIVR